MSGATEIPPSKVDFASHHSLLGFLGILLLATVAGSAPLPAAGQISLHAAAAQKLPAAPMPPADTPQGASNNMPVAAPPPAPTPGGNLTLTLKQAEALALKNNPQITAAHLIALASQQVTREARSNLWPTVSGNITAVDALSGTRLSAGALNNPVLYERVGMGMVVTQLITDFGRTANQVSSANYAAKAENENAQATRQQILLAVDKAFFSALQAQAVLKVAQQTVDERQTVSNQVTALYQSKLKSELDLSFANVNLAQARLLLLDAQNNQDATEATLSMVLGFGRSQHFQLIEETSQPTTPPGNVDGLIAQAFASRPEILALQFEYQSAKKLQTAERDRLFPTIRAVGVVGDTPAGNPAVAPSPSAFNNTYGAVGANVEIPIFNGFLYTARAKEAQLRAQAFNERLRDLQNLIARDVHASWLNANESYQRIGVTQQLLQQAAIGLHLAQARYKLGLGSIVELSQAQLQQTQAQISSVQADYDYRLSLAILAYETKGI